MSHRRIEDILKGGVEVDSTVSVSGWVRTRRDSKAGFSFVNVHDGTCFSPLQVIAESLAELGELRLELDGL